MHRVTPWCSSPDFHMPNALGPNVASPLKGSRDSVTCSWRLSSGRALVRCNQLGSDVWLYIWRPPACMWPEVARFAVFWDCWYPHCVENNRNYAHDGITYRSRTRSGAQKHMFFSWMSYQTVIWMTFLEKAFLYLGNGEELNLLGVFDWLDTL